MRKGGWGGYHRMMVVTSDQGGSGMAGCDHGCPGPEMSRAGQGRLPVPGPAGGGWPMSGVARVTNWSRDHSVTGAGQALSSVTPGQSRVRWHSESGAETGTRLWHSVRDTPGTGRHRDTSVTVWHSDVTRNTDNIITLESFTTHGCVRVL